MKLRRLLLGIPLFLLMLLLSQSAYGQTPACPFTIGSGCTTVVGTVVDPSGVPYSFATVKAQVTPLTNPLPVINGQSFPTNYSVVASSTGSFSFTIPDNSRMSPQSSSYQTVFTVSIQPAVPLPFGTGPQVFTITVTVSGASQNITSQLNAAAPALTTISIVVGGNVTHTGPLTAGQPVLGNGGGDITSGPINLAGGASYVTNILPTVNLPGGGVVTINSTSCTIGASCSIATGGVSAGSQYAFQYSSDGAGGFAAPAVPIANGVYTCGYSVSASVAVAPDCTLVGVQNVGISGATTSFLFDFSDNGGIVTHDVAASGTVAITLPTATTMLNANYITSYCNYSAQTDVVTPTTWTIMGAATLNVTTNVCYLIHPDPNSATNWIAEASAPPGTGAVTGSGTNNIVTKFTGASSIGNSSISDDGTNPTRAPNGLNTGLSGNLIERTVDTGGVTVNKLACRSSVNKAVICPTNTTSGVLGVAQATVASTGTVKIFWGGLMNIVASNTFTAGHWLIPSTTVAGDVEDTGSASQPTTGVQTFLAESSGTSGQSVTTDVLSPDTLNAAGGGKPNTILINSSNGQPVTNFNGTTPAAPGGNTNCIWQTSNSGNTTNASCYMPTAAGGYATIQNTGTPVTQQTTLNFKSAGSGNVNCVNNGGASSTDCTVTGILGLPSPTVQYLSAAYAIPNSDNNYRDVWTSGTSGAVAITLPQANTISTSPYVGTSYSGQPSVCTTCTTSTFSQSAGHALVVWIQWSSASVTLNSPITDTAGDTFQKLATDVVNIGPNHENLSGWVAFNVSANASNAVTATFSGSLNPAPAIQVNDYLLNSPLDQASSVGAGSGTISLTNTVTSSPEVALGAISLNGGGGCPSGWTNRTQTVGASADIRGCERLIAGQNSVTLTQTGVGAMGMMNLSNYIITSTPTYVAGWQVQLVNNSFWNLTVTPSTSTINGRATLVIVPSEQCTIQSDGTNYAATCGSVPNNEADGTIGQPIEINGFNITNTSTDVTTTSLVSAGTIQVDAFFNVQAAIACHAATATGTMVLTIGYTDTSNTAQTATASVACTTLGAASISSANVLFRAKAASAITYAYAHGGTQSAVDVSIAAYQLSTK